MTFNIYISIEEWCECSDLEPFLYHKDVERLKLWYSNDKPFVFSRIDISLVMPITKKYKINSVKFYTYFENSNGFIFEVKKFKNIHKFLCDYCFDGFEMLK